MKAIAIMMLMMLVLVPMASATLGHNHADSDDSLTRDRDCFSFGGCSDLDNSQSNSVNRKSSGSTFLTQWIWNGQSCMKQDVITFPVEMNADSKLAPGYVKVKYIVEPKEGKMWVSKIIPGKYGVVLDKDRNIVSEPTCNIPEEPMSPYVTPLLINWYKGYFN